MDPAEGWPPAGEGEAELSRARLCPAPDSPRARRDSERWGSLLGAGSTLGKGVCPCEAWLSVTYLVEKLMTKAIPTPPQLNPAAPSL